MSQVLAARGISTAEEAAAFLERGRDLTCSPFLMKDMDRAVECISRAIGQGLRMAVFGDYDVDGITATVILVDYPEKPGRRCAALYSSPHRGRLRAGQDAIRSLHEQGVELLITVDCGITGVEEVDFAASLGMDVVITDHHECKDTLPRAVAVVDPHRPDCTYPFPYLAGCGVALKLVLALGGESREEALFLPLLHLGRHRHHCRRDAHVRGEPHHRLPWLGVHHPVGLHRPPRPAAGGRPHG